MPLLLVIAMSKSVLSPDGHWLWTGEEWVPAPPKTPPNAVENAIEEIEEIAEQKMKDLNAIDLQGAVQMVRGSARSMGLEVVEG